MALTDHQEFSYILGFLKRIIVIFSVASSPDPFPLPKPMSVTSCPSPVVNLSPSSSPPNAKNDKKLNFTSIKHHRSSSFTILQHSGVFQNRWRQASRAIYEEQHWTLSNTSYVFLNIVSISLTHKLCIFAPSLSKLIPVNPKWTTLSIQHLGRQAPRVLFMKNNILRHFLCVPNIASSCPIIVFPPLLIFLFVHHHAKSLHVDSTSNTSS